MEKVTFEVRGMSCLHCVKAVTDAIAALSGVHEINVSLEQNSATVTYVPEAVTLETIKDAVRAEEYEC